MSAWKDALHRYVAARNRLEVDCSAAEMQTMLEEDARFMREIERKRSRLQWIYHERNIEPVRQETRMMIERARPAEEGMTVDLLLKRSFVYDQHKHRFTEERFERQRLAMKQDRGEWIISEIVEEVPETQGEMIAVQQQGGKMRTWDDSAEHTQANAPKSRPFINRMVLDSSKPLVRRQKYNRSEAVRYADLWWDHPNPQYKHFQVNCTNFVSQCLYAGGAPMTYTGKRESGWWYRHEHGGNWSFSWSVAHSLYWYLAKSTSGLTAKQVDAPTALELGDVILYDWDGDGRWQHSVIVTAFDGNGMPLVNANTTNSKHRYWDYRDSYAWSDRTKYRFFRISDLF